MARSTALARLPLIGETSAPAGAIVNILLRISIVAMSVDALVNASDQRFAGKALGPRDVLISLGFAMLFPLFWKLRYGRREWREYPWWFDCLYLSLFAFDMAGNSFGWYNSIGPGFNDVTHTYGNGALTIVLAGAFGFTALEAMGLTTILHLIMQVEEFYGDKFLHTHNIVGMEGEYEQFVGGLIATTVCGLTWYFSRSWREKRAKRLRRPTR